MVKGYHVGFDGFDPISAIAAKAAGAVAVSGYLVGDTAMTKQWVADATAAGLGVWSAWELSASAPENGTNQGRQDAQEAVTAAWALGQTAGTAIYLTNDSVVFNWTNVVDYFQAAATIILNAGYIPALYGQTAVWDKAIPYGYRYFWHAPDGTDPPFPAQIVQSGKETLSSGETVDIDDILNIDFGGWNNNGLFPAPIKPPPPPEESMLGTYAEGDNSPGILNVKAVLIQQGYQQSLTDRGLPPMTVTADAGPSFIFAVERFRFNNKLQASPTWDANCYAALFPTVST